MYNPEKLNPDPIDGGVEKKEKLPSLTDLVDAYFKGEMYKADPAGFALHLSSLDFGQKDYEGVLPMLEEKCSKNIKLLNKYRLSLRGDCLPEEYIQNPPEREFTGAVRNRFSEMKTPNEKNATKFQAMIECLFRLNYAYRYDYHNHKKAIEATPCLMYGFRKFASTDIEEAKYRHGVGDYFYGHADDVGSDFKNIHFIRLPRSTSFDENRESGEYVQMFPYSNYMDINVDYQTSPTDYARTKKIIKTIGEKKLDPQQFGVVVAQLRNIRTYFDVLLLVDKILTDIEEFDRNTAQ